MPESLNRFYLLSDGGSDRALRVQLASGSDAYSVLRGETIPPEPIILDVTSGKRVLDLIGTGHAGIYLVSPKFISVLQTSGFSGWRGLESVVRQSGEPILPGYRLLTITGRSGPIEDGRSERLLIPSPTAGSAVGGWRGILFDPATWDGSDLFLPANTAHTIVLDRVRDALLRVGITGAEFERITDIERMWSVN